MHDSTLVALQEASGYLGITLELPEVEMYGLGQAQSAAAALALDSAIVMARRAYRGRGTFRPLPLDSKMTAMPRGLEAVAAATGVRHVAWAQTLAWRASESRRSADALNLNARRHGMGIELGLVDAVDGRVVGYAKVLTDRDPAEPANVLALAEAAVFELATGRAVGVESFLPWPEGHQVRVRMQDGRGMLGRIVRRDGFELIMGAKGDPEMRVPLASTQTLSTTAGSIFPYPIQGRGEWWWDPGLF